MATDSRKDRQPYQGQVLSQLELMGDLGTHVNPYGRSPEADTEKPKRSRSSREVPLFPMPPDLGWLFKKPPEAPLPQL